MSYFPMFTELKGKKCVVIGGGTVALRKIKVLLDFGAVVAVYAPDFCEEILRFEQEIAYAKQDKPTAETVALFQKKFEDTDLAQAYLVVAATDAKQLNHEIAEKCRERRIPCNAVDQIEDCSFIFPSYVKEGEVVAAFSSGGQSPAVTQYLKAAIKPVLNETLGEIAQSLGTLRKEVKAAVPTEEMRKRCYQEILQKSLEGEHTLSEAELASILKKYQNTAK